ncbi:MAG: hypothetical protein N2450_02385 [bacterium]|nr:hypothetical protein [bacterium]
MSAIAQKQPSLIVLTDVDSIDFGKLVAGPAYRRQIELKNLGNETIHLEEWQSNCPCLSIEGLPSEIEPQNTALITLVLKTEPIDRGYYGSSLFILSDDPIRPILKIPIKVIWTDALGNIKPSEQEMKEFLSGASQDYVPPTNITIDTLRKHQAIDLLANPKFDSLLKTLPQQVRDQWIAAIQSISKGQERIDSPLTIQEPLILPSGEINWKSGELTPRMFDSIYTVMQGLEWIPPEVEESEWVQQVSSPIIVEFFHSYTCRECKKAKEIIEPTILRYGGRVRLKYYSTDSDSGLARLIEFQKLRKVKAKPFLLIVGPYSFTKLEELDTLANAIDSILVTRETGIVPYRTNGEVLKNTFTNLSFWTLISAGLLDGINPCAFSTIIFFLSFLTYIGSNRRQILTVGISFCLAVFCTYLLLGIGAFGILTQLKTFQLISEIIYWITAVLLGLLILLTIRDLWTWLNGAPPSDAILQLPNGLKKKIHQVIKENLTTKGLFIGAVLIGFLVSLFESICTGQVYLPTIVILLNDPLLSSQAWLYLILYNLMFIVPLLIVFVLAYNGVSSQRFSVWVRDHYGWVKFALLLLFCMLFVIMIGEIL